MRQLLFYRDFHGLTGGHLKVWDYFCHTKQSSVYSPRIIFSGRSSHDHSNPWFDGITRPRRQMDLEGVAAVFLAGLDWYAFPNELTCPVINLIQGVRHATHGDPRRQFLARRALRICVSEEVAAAIQSTGQVNGPIVTIPCGLDLDALPEPSPTRDIPLLIAGAKNPQLAHGLAGRLRRSGVAFLCLVDQLPRSQFLNRLGRSRIVVTLPAREEGFFLPALEAMAMGCMVVCPDAIGNRGFCRDRETCLVPPYTEEGVFRSILDARALPPWVFNELLLTSRRVAESHSLGVERQTFLQVLDRLDQIV